MGKSNSIIFRENLKNCTKDSNNNEDNKKFQKFKENNKKKKKYNFYFKKIKFFELQEKRK